MLHTLGRLRMAALGVCLLLSSLAVRAQMDVQFSDYTRLRSYYNPAVSGTDGLLNVAAAYALQFLGYDDAPGSMYVGADMPVYFLNAHHGAGVNFMSDQAGMFTQQRIGLQYAYNFRVGKRGRLAVGVSVALLTETIDGSDVELEDQSDPAFPSGEESGNSVDFSAGIYYYHPRFWAGFSSQHLSAPTLVLDNQYEFAIDRIYYLTAGCNIPLRNTFLTLQPSFMVMSDMDNWREDVQVRLQYEYEKRSLYAGVGYSPDISVTFMVGGVFHGISLGYSYQMYTGGVGLGNGSHEISLGYQTDLDLFKKGRNRHRSVRFL